MMASRTLWGWARPGTICLAVLLTACAPASTALAPVADSEAVAAPPIAAESAGDLLHLVDAGQLALVDTQRGIQLSSTPLGVIAPGGERMYVTNQEGGNTIVRALDLATGEAIAETSLAGRFSFPEVVGGPAVVLGGIDPTGRWLALESHLPSGLVSGTMTYDSTFAILDTALQGEPQVVPLEGQFNFDGLSKDGRWLYLTETPSPFRPNYFVRAYDLKLGEMLPDPLVDKREPDEAMVGFRHAVANSPDGSWLYSLYLRPGEGAFVHALNLSAQAALCIDLPPGQVSDELSDFAWSMALSQDGRSIYAVNTQYLLAAEIDLDDFRVVKVNQIELADSPSGPLAGAWLQDLASWMGVSSAEAKAVTSGSAVLSPDGKTVYAAGETLVLAVHTADLSLVGAWMRGQPTSSLGISPDGARLYAVLMDTPRIAVIDTATGRVVRYVDGAREPWSILSVTSSTK